jgi:hypothetical protein
MADTGPIFWSHPPLSNVGELPGTPAQVLDSRYLSRFEQSGQPPDCCFPPFADVLAAFRAKNVL